jgi:hypothetical protein
MLLNSVYVCSAWLYVCLCVRVRARSVNNKGIFGRCYLLLTCLLHWRCNTTYERIHLSPAHFCHNNKSNVCYLYKSENTFKNATNSQQCCNLKLREWLSRQTLLYAGAYCAKHQNFRSPVPHTNVIW